MGAGDLKLAWLQGRALLDNGMPGKGRGVGWHWGGGGGARGDAEEEEDDADVEEEDANKEEMKKVCVRVCVGY